MAYIIERHYDGVKTIKTLREVPKVGFDDLKRLDSLDDISKPEEYTNFNKLKK